MASAEIKLSSFAHAGGLFLAAQCDACLILLGRLFGVLPNGRRPCYKELKTLGNEFHANISSSTSDKVQLWRKRENLLETALNDNLSLTTNQVNRVCRSLIDFF